MRLDNHTHETQKRAFQIARTLEDHRAQFMGFRTQEMADGSRRVVTFADGVDQHDEEFTVRVVSPAPNVIAPQWALDAYNDWTVQILDGEGCWQELRV